MRIAVLGTAMVGRAIAGRLSALGHDVVVGTRDVERTLGHTEDRPGIVSFARWQQAHPAVQLTTLADAGAQGEVIVNATHGAASLNALEATGATNLAGKVLLDIGNPLDVSQGMPPRLTVANTDSLGEQIQRAYPEARVVKSLNTMHAEIMVDPGRLPGHHNVFVAGEDAEAKETVKSLLGEFGWPDEAIIDLGGIKAARAVEMYGELLFAVAAATGTFHFNIGITRK
ncbi:NADP oxidoreductase [Streptomyces sp. Ru62]|uniref:NADPH-dependent F420 reductase n=1 Tax=Streptomyces sp. Ru62 TaxID=2080745 RepID=UPI000CDD5F60|nr:NAD(P)-binding domain-containing protein [Streptomyces sp. Ru62]POX58690.1 NADP oxidoreductase [Streptomyces sp. Ru62]